jgi:hypothetical protein
MDPQYLITDSDPGGQWEERRHQADMVKTFKILHCYDKVNGETLFVRADQANLSTASATGPLNLKQQAARLEVRRTFFSQREKLQKTKSGNGGTHLNDKKNWRKITGVYYTWTSTLPKRPYLGGHWKSTIKNTKESN